MHYRECTKKVAGFLCGFRGKTEIDKDQEMLSSNAMRLYVRSVITQEKIPGVAIQYNLDDLSRGKIKTFLSGEKFKSIGGKLPFLKRYTRGLSEIQKRYICDKAGISRNFTESIIEKRHSKLVPYFFRTKKYNCKGLPPAPDCHVMTSKEKRKVFTGSFPTGTTEQPTQTIDQPTTGQPTQTIDQPTTGQPTQTIDQPTTGQKGEERGNS